MVTMLNFRFQNAHQLIGDMMVEISIFLIYPVYYVLFLGVWFRLLQPYPNMVTLAKKHIT